MTVIEDPTVVLRRENVASHLAAVLYTAGAVRSTIADLNDLAWSLAVQAAAAIEQASAEAEDRPATWTPSVGYLPSPRTRERVEVLIDRMSRPLRMVPPEDCFRGLPS